MAKWSFKLKVLSVCLLFVSLNSTSSSALAGPPVVSGPTLTKRYIPMPEELSVAEQNQLADLGAALAKSDTPEKGLPILTEELAKLKEPSKLRGLVQFIRAGVFLHQDQLPAATDAIEESVRLLPGYSGPLVIASEIHAYANRPGLAADYLIRASDVDPASVAQLDDYEVDNVMRRLRVARDERRLASLSNRLLAIGWVGTRLGSRSSLAQESIKREMIEGHVASARALVSKLLVPSHAYALLTNDAYREIWPDIEQWAGPRLERQWRVYLDEARNRWRANRNPQTTQDYAVALAAAGHDKTVIRDVLPIFFGKVDPDAEMDLVFVVPTVAGALARQGRWDDVELLFARASEIWKPGSSANALNAAANRGRYLVMRGRFADSLPQLDSAITEARRWDVNPDALAAIYHYRACALAALGRLSEAKVAAMPASAVEFSSAVAHLQLCLGNKEAARTALLKGLQVPANRDDVLGFVQKLSETAIQSEYAESLRSAVKALAADPLVLAAIAKVGRVLPFGVNEGAPAESP